MPRPLNDIVRAILADRVRLQHDDWLDQIADIWEVHRMPHCRYLIATGRTFHRTGSREFAYAVTDPRDYDLHLIRCGDAEEARNRLYMPSPPEIITD